MRHEHETATSFNQLREITQIMQVKEARTQTSANAKDYTQEPTQKTTLKLKPKSSAQAQKERLNPTKKAFSERQKTAFRDNSQASDEKRLQTNQANNSNLKAEPSAKAFKPGLASTQEKGGSDE
ncbi:hypothetical protein HMPREF1427_00007 [Helicobacter pylori GAM83Bi]|uniref:hypothetical protein n=1 Tax=Helicobacter pylori TaxID=210 RepID=UPI0002B9AEC2|nr:hypothetical protein [Helicobacter pylori]EMH39873.1 hypothetical protein HMPREF1427_00007 [Helicobacter pylori GAM83Bi]EMH41039.1 hypothetical protein HMPREF1428_00116 [Helicobacter pylori GAM83T]